MSFLELAKERYSVRKYSDKPVEDEKLALILEAAKVAPTAKNNQPQKIYVVRSSEALAKLNAVCPCIFGAPQAFVVCYDTETVWKNPLRKGYDSGEIDAAIVATHMMMEAWELGLGSCWVGFFNDRLVAEALELPENVKPAVIMPFGYAAAGAKPSELHTTYRPADETVTEV